MLNKEYWQERWEQDQTGWDLGEVAPVMKQFFEGIDKRLRILIPGGGNSYEGQYLHELGFTEVFVADLAQQPLQNLLARCPEFPADHLLNTDFFEIDRAFDLIIEQTFFCAIDPTLRPNYVRKVHDLLANDGRLCGLFFASNFDREGPPFGGTKEEYQQLFSPWFSIDKMEISKGSVPPRQGNELWFECTKKAVPLKDE